ncbi:MAG: tRNA (N(6)-L-threonylcarbamoyladenosine(37)-C(2))-methylthiotransferase MtaB [Bacteroidetes bacterium]|nr:MAG: tRNA (N(6)-L-threonylcarbamoyladenosine(37)-C(2))-methylthiotransferase MtaB [Bacteroidota bacterium]RLD89783.1 MAG: tRNA (N(6)-L-threonylcarbamoyladenosine(37)-C(2))-methylthiotransferase MtaB [Bacteroidota bacterium]
MKRIEMKKVAFKTLGCRLNLYETDAIAAEFARKGYKVVDFGPDADIYVINTCTVTNQSDRKSRSVLNQSYKLNKDALTIVTGCMATNYKEQLAENEKVDYVVDNEHKTSVLSVVESHFKGEIVNPDQFEKDVFNYAPAEETFHTRSFIKIQDGCNHFCTYCIVPKVRGRAISRPAEDIFENIRKVVDFGYREIVLTGVNLGTYTYESYDFEKLVEAILEIPGDFRVRISSIEPDGYSASFFRLFKNPKLTPHMHICLQSGSEEILRNMRRMYTAEEFLQLTEKIRADYPDFNLTTDIIVGFPGETEVHFNETVEMVKKIGFGHMHTFKYSVRKGTRAERMPDQVDEKTKTKRSEVIRRLGEETKFNYRKSFIGKRQRVLVEKINRRGFATGYGEHYIPVVIETKGLNKNEFYNVVVSGIETGEEPVLKAYLTED